MYLYTVLFVRVHFDLLIDLKTCVEFYTHSTQTDKWKRTSHLNPGTELFEMIPGSDGFED